MQELHESILTRAPEPFDKRVLYGHGPSQFIDLRIPATMGGPVVIVIHGGFWRVKYGVDHISHLCAAITASGFISAGIEYRRVGEPGGGWSGSFDDVESALTCVLDLYPARKAPVVVGHSAGGHLALWLGVRRPQQISRIVGLAPVTSLTLAWEQHLGYGAVADLLEGSPDEVPDRYAWACPSERATHVPRTLIHGLNDGIVPLEQSRRYVNLRSQEREKVDLIELPNAAHFDLIDPQSACFGKVLAEMLAVPHAR